MKSLRAYQIINGAAPQFDTMGTRIETGKLTPTIAYELSHFNGEYFVNVAQAIDDKFFVDPTKEFKTLVQASDFVSHLKQDYK